MNPTPSRQRGLTLVELAVVGAITALLAGTAAPRLQGLLDARRLDGAATQLATDLQFARGEAVSRNQPVRISFHADAASATSCYVIHTGLAAQCSCGASGAASCSGGAQQIKTVRWTAADRVSLQANAGSMLFDPLHGTSTPTGTLRVIASDGRAVHHVVNVMGRIRSCSPQAAMTGYRAC